MPEIVGGIVARVSELDEIGESLPLQELISNVIKLAIIALVMFTGRIIWRLGLFNASINTCSDLRQEMFVHSEKMSQRYFQENKTGALMSLFTNDLETIDDTIGGGTINAVDGIFMGGLALYKMIKVNWIVSLVALIPLLCFGVIGVVVGKYMEKKYEKRQECFERLSDFAQENFTGISVIKAFVKEVHEIRQFSKLNEENKKVNIEFARLGAILDVAIEVLIYACIVLILVISGVVMTNSPAKMGVGDLVTFLGLFDCLIWPMFALGGIINIHSRGKASLKRIAGLLDEKVEILDLFPAEVETISGSIEFKDFSFTYPGSDNPSLQNITLKINKGENVGIIGKIGCGKTTLVNVLLHLYNVDENKILIDGVDLMHMPIKLLRDSIGYVPQDNFLFSDEVGNNIRFANANLSQEQTEDAASFADVDENIKGFKEGYHTRIGERGVTLSGGQKQRISIARAIVKDPSILILDDSVSAVDLKTEEKILKNIKSRRKGKTTLIIASRVSTVDSLDRVIVLNDGKVEAFDTPTNLLKSSPTYQRMVELQKLEQEVEGE